MSLSNTVCRNDYTGNGTANTYSYAFPIFEEQDLTLYVTNTASPPAITELTLGTDYTVNDVGEISGGTIQLVNNSQAWLTAGNLTTGYILTILRVRALEQLTDIRNQGAFFPEIIEEAFDEQMMVSQQQQEQIGRCLSLPVNLKPSAFNPVLPTEIVTPNATLQVNGSGDGFIVVPPVGVTGIYGTPAQEVPSGTVNGTNTAFTLSNTPISNASVTVYLDGILMRQGPSLDYTISGTTITFNSAPVAGQEPYAVYQH